MRLEDDLCGGHQEMSTPRHPSPRAGKNRRQRDNLLKRRSRPVKVVRRHFEQNLRIRCHRHNCPPSIPSIYWTVGRLPHHPFSVMDRMPRNTQIHSSRAGTLSWLLHARLILIWRQRLGVPRLLRYLLARLQLLHLQFPAGTMGTDQQPDGQDQQQNPRSKSAKQHSRILEPTGLGQTAKNCSNRS